jgi:hypothetical protein
LDLGQNCISFLLAVLFGGAIYHWRNNSANVVIALVGYCSLYYIYTSPAIIFGYGEGQTGWLTSQARNKVGMAGALSVLLLFMYVSLSYWKIWASRFRFKYGLMVLLAAIPMAVGYLCKIRLGESIALEDFSSVTAVIFVLVLLPIVATITIADFNNALRRVMPFLVGLLFLVVVFGYYEVASQKAWAAYPATNGLWIFKASSIFFTPGWFGPWLALIWIIQMYAAQSKLVTMTMSVFGLAVNAAGVFIAGSRATLVVIAILMLILYLMSDRSDRKQIFIGSVTFVGAFCASIFVWLTLFTPHAVASGFHALGALAERWFAFPTEVVSYISYKLSVLSASSASSVPSVPSASSVSPEFIAVVEDRVSGGKRDSAFLTVLDHGGWVSFGGILALLILWGYNILSLLRSNAASITKAYAVLLFIDFVAAGIHGRVLQAFPAWLIAGSLVIATSLWLARTAERLH